jgi:hypothetical protein
MDVRLARLDEKLEHMIRSQEDAGRHSRDSHAALRRDMSCLNDRLQKVEVAVLTASVSWKAVIKMSAIIGVVMAACYKLLTLMGVSIIIK